MDDTRINGCPTSVGMLPEDESISIEYPDIREYDDSVKLKSEKEVVGVYISGHPLSKYVDKMKSFTFTSDMIKTDNEEVVDLPDEEGGGAVIEGIQDGSQIVAGGIIVEVKKLLTKQGNKEMAVIVVEDLYGTFDCMLFPNAYAKCKHVLMVDNLVTIKGKINLRDDEPPIILTDSVEEWEQLDAVIEKNEEIYETLYLRFDTTDQNVYNDIVDILSAYPGKSEVKIKCSNTGKVFKMNMCVNLDSLIKTELLAVLEEKDIVIR